MAYMRERQSKWDRRHLVTVSTHLNDREYDLLRAACRADCTTPYKLVRDFLQGYIEAAGGAHSRPHRRPPAQHWSFRHITHFPLTPFAICPHDSAWSRASGS